MVFSGRGVAALIVTTLASTSLASVDPSVDEYCADFVAKTEPADCKLRAPPGARRTPTPTSSWAQQREQTT